MDALTIKSAALTSEDVRASLAELDQGIPWTHHFNLCGVDTISAERNEQFYRKSVGTKKLIELALFYCRMFSRTGDVRDRRVLDVACGEGAYSIAFAEAGAAEVMGVEGRQLAVDRARFVATVLERQNVRFVQGDVRCMVADGVPPADITLCVGILHHLGPEDFLAFLQSLSDLTEDVLFLYTHVSSAPAVKEFDLIGPLKVQAGMAGYLKVDHSAGITGQDMGSHMRSSLDNRYSFWANEEALVRGLKAAGFSTILKAFEPHAFSRHDDRNTRVILIARK
jgi:SAM-dependent methyltransferase